MRPHPGRATFALCLATAWTLATGGPAGAADARKAFRPPAVPLVACDPYFSVWSDADKLTDDATRHWTGKKQPLGSMIRLDGKAYRLMGDEPKGVPALPQVAVHVLPTRTIYEFAGPQAQVTLTFTTPALPDDLDVLSWPLTYLTWDVKSTDGAPHEAALYFAAGAELAVNLPDQEVAWSRSTAGDLTALRVGSAAQPVLQAKGDDLRIDWGYAYAAAPKNEARGAIGPAAALATAFVDGGKLPAEDDARQPRAVKQDPPALAFAFDLGKVGAESASRHVLLAYDDEYSITYFRRKLRPYWRRDGATAADLLKRADAEYEALRDRCKAFDAELMKDLEAAGGREYAVLAALSYRQALAANKIAADANGKPLLFPKENFSNGCIATVDVIYPMDPLFLLLSPTLAKASLVPVLNYAASGRWKFPFAPHDLGTYPLANGQVYGGGERTEVDQMPVEETGNMLLLLAAIAQEEGSAEFASAYWPQLKMWAAYLEDKGFDPENQLCTDDFAGHLAHNVNLSAKAILALGAYGQLCDRRGEKAEGQRYHGLAAGMAKRWVKEADDGDHFRLAFDRPGTWSQKYNLVWDKILGLDIFPDDAIKKEYDFYRRNLDKYGLPLDNRQPYAKLDWTVWTATLATDRAGFEALVRPVYAAMDASPSRVPLTDWYFTKDAKQVGFQARSVVGGVFIRLLDDPATWKKWAGRDKVKVPASAWAPLPPAPVIEGVVPTAESGAIAWHYTTGNPEGDWTRPGYDDSRWKEGPGGFGSPDTPGTAPHLRTEWRSPDIWLRREFTLPAGGRRPGLQLRAFHDEDAEIYLNGVPAAKVSGYSTEYDLQPISDAAGAALKPGKNVLAVHCHQTKGGQYIDVGIVDVREGGR